MRKRNKLYTANQWNQPLFMQNLQDDKPNLFLTGGETNTMTADFTPYTSLGSNNTRLLGNDSSIQMPNFSDLSGINNQRMSELGAKAGEQMKRLKASSSGGVNMQKKEAAKALVNTGLEITGMIGQNDKFKRGLWDRADPLHYLAGGRESKAGNALGDAGVSVFKQGAQSGNGYMMIAGAALKGVGSLTNAAFGTKVDKERLNAINSGVDTLNSFKSNATDFDDVKGPDSIVSNAKGVYQGGWFSKGSANKKSRKLQEKVTAAQEWADRSVDNNINNIANTQMDTMLANYAALGGPLGGYQDTGGAIDYGFTSDYLLTKNKAADNKNKVQGNIFNDQQQKPIFALGGDMQMYGGDFSDGLMHINAGGSHEENPYDGVQIGISRENGNPNLVEEGETIFDDYVFSKRLKADKKTKAKFHIGKKSDITFADLSKRLEKESLERPNDPISQAGLTKQLHALADEQERQKGEQAEDAFAQLPPEQQQAIMQQVAMEQQAQQQQMAAQQEEQPSEEEMMAQQQAAQQGGEEQMMQGQPQEEVQMAANGGRINKFSDGGDMRKRSIYKALGFYLDSQFKDWAKKKGLDENIDWENIKDNTALWDALGSKGAALKDAIVRGYDYGAYTPSFSDIYDLDSFKDELEAYTASKNPGKSNGHYVPDKNFPLGNFKTIKDLENSDAYKAYTKYVKDAITRNKGIKYRYKEGTEPAYENVEYANPDRKLSEEDYNILRTLYRHINGTSTNPDNEHVPLSTKSSDGYYSLADNADDLFEQYRTDGEAGIFHLTPKAKTRGQKKTNLLVHDDGSVEEIYGDVPKGLTINDTYSWKDPIDDNIVTYYNEAAAKEDKKKADERKYVPKHKDTWGRDAGLMGPLVGLGMQMAGVGKPDYAGVNAAVSIANGSPTMAHYKPLGNYVKYNPMDIWFEQNRANANSRATDRAILNNASPLGAKTAGLLANSYNSQIASGDLYKKALEYNDAQRYKTAEFNRATDQYNSEAFNKTSITNAQIANNNRQFRAQMAMDAAKQKMASDAAWYQGIYGNLNSYFKGLGDWGRENAQHNMIADMVADGIFGTMSDKQYTAKDYLEEEKANKHTKGGRIKRRRGLTF